jgi:CMP-N,N'-diacetyllegionaminic acid synthase
MDSFAGGFESASAEATCRDKHALDYYDPTGAEIIARQQRTPVLHRNDIAYAMTCGCLVEQCKVNGTRAGAFIDVSIDCQEDLAHVESISGGC